MTDSVISSSQDFSVNTHEQHGTIHPFLEDISMNPISSQESNNNEPYGNEIRRLSDPIHKFIELPKSIWRIVDTPQFQRLRYIKQLGITGFVFNGANHTRFEHCLGVAYLSWTYMDSIAKNHSFKYQEMGLEDESHFDRVKLLVTIAGLCHDLGHGPFSHMFDNVLLPKLGETTWKHEDGSCMMLKDLLEETDGEFTTNPISYKTAKFIPDDDVDIVLDMIQGLTKEQWKDKYGKTSLPKWCFDIVSNKTTTIDVDKFDYLKRDPAGLKITHEFSHEILFRETRIIKGEICYNSKTHDMIYDIFHIRYKLFKQIYLHPVTLGIELMLADALSLSAAVYDYRTITRDPKQYLHLTDSIIERITMNEDERLAESKRLIRRIYNRQLYRFVGEVVVDYKSNYSNDEIIKGIQAYSKNAFGMKVTITKEELSNIAVSQSRINYSMGEQDPVQKVLFYKSSNPYEGRPLNTQNSSLLRPSKFGEKSIRIFSRQNDTELINKIKSGFANFAQEVLKKEQTAYDKKDQSSIKGYSASKLQSPYEPAPSKKFMISPERGDHQMPSTASAIKNNSSSYRSASPHKTNNTLMPPKNNPSTFQKQLF